ncbi:MAG: triose-phosphate isomerase [Legionellales bacterium]|nr:triose-phosphate isomerase [Legionellales bacterium]
MNQLIIANWKMNADRQWFPDLVRTIVRGCSSQNEVVLCPPYPFLYEVGALLDDSPASLGAQDVSEQDSGAYTGQVSASMLSTIGCEYVLVGHSERRQYNHESNELVAQKFAASQAAGLKPVFCVGESLRQRENDQTEDVISDQLAPLLALGIEQKDVIVAYEPVWAIGTGKSASPEQAQAVHAFIRSKLPAKSLKILYGGSVKGDNASSLFAMPDIDGGLVGGASLDAESFLKICNFDN